MSRMMRKVANSGAAIYSLYIALLESPIGIRIPRHPTNQLSTDSTNDTLGGSLCSDCTPERKKTD